jgi:tRNA-2-methylthio-N6-dimethylallyladenosine synthase
MQRVDSTMPNRTYCLVTFGCQMNDADSEMISGILEVSGWERIESEPEADLVLFNTCVVRQGAEDRAVARLQTLKSSKQHNPNKIIGICGCLAQQDGESLISRLPMVDLVMGTRALPRLPSLLRAIETTGQAQVCVDLEGDPYDIPFEPRRAAGVVGRINIIYGCNKNCSYCIVPSTRGRELSRPSEVILSEARSLAEQGYREVLLIGQNVNSYCDGVVDLARLLEMVNEVEGIDRIRFITSHPRDADEGMFRAIGELPKVCEALHLPVQSGSSAVLKRMYRGYSREMYLEKIERLRRHTPDVVLTTDIIVGFPGETDGDYEQTLSLVSEVRFDSAFMFMYSPREGTKAAEWPDDVPLDVKKDRLKRLIDLQEGISAEVNNAQIGRRLEVLVERSARRSPGSMAGRSRGDKTVVFPAPPGLAGRTVEVEITSSTGHTLIGRMV